MDESGTGLALADVVVINRATGVSLRARSRAQGRYVVAGLEVGGPYTVVVRRLGSREKTLTGLFLNLGQRLRVDVRLNQQPVALQGMETNETQSRTFSRAHKGTETLVSESMIGRLPSFNRDLYDLVRLVPQLSTWSAITSSGANPKVNNIRIDGVTDQVLSSNLAAGALYGGRVLPLEAVKEYRVLLSPFDVREGSFAGASVSAVTKGGTNDLHGSAFVYGTNEQLGANVPFIRNTRYSKAQFGFSLGGPVVPDRLHFFVATELQQRRIPATGPYVGQGSTSDTPMPVTPNDVARFQQLLSARGLEGGTAGAVSNPNPGASVFVRLDAPLPGWNSRLVVRGTYGRGDSSIFSRPTTIAPSDCPTSDCFALSSLRQTRWVDKRSVALELFSNLVSGASNELIVGYVTTLAGFTPDVRQPLVLVTVRGASGAPALLQSGTHEAATGQRNVNRASEFTDNVTLQAGAHRMTVGATAQIFVLRAFQLRGAYGVWQFGSLDSLETGAASRYRVTRDTGSTVSVSGGQYALYVGDDWDATTRLSLTLGIRADLPSLVARPPYVALVDSVLHLRTDGVPGKQVQWSPRLGFNLDLTRRGGAPTQLRGGLGAFTGRAPLFWLFGGFSSYGLASRTLQCGSLGSDAGPPPAFETDYSNQPFACANGRTFGVGSATQAEIDVLDPHLRLPQVLRASLAADRALPHGIEATVEALYTRTIHSVFYSGINLSAPNAVDRHGRVMYGTVGTTGTASPNRASSRLGDVIEVTNQSRDYAYDLTGELRRTGRIADVAASLTYGRSRDVQSQRVTSGLLIDNWRFARTVAGREDDMTPGVSDFDQPLRVRASGTLHTPWRRYATDLSFSYIGGSGIPYTYVAGGAASRGDLNADGAIGNDPIYIPRSARDTAEIQFGGTSAEVSAQQAAFERFVDTATCLRRQRGRIMSRNSCRGPWMSLTNAALRQTGPHSLSLEMQVFNVLNLLNARWGLLQMPTGAALPTTSQVALLSQVGQTPGGGTQSQPIYRFNTTMRRYTSDNTDSYYQIQFALRYSF